MGLGPVVTPPKCPLCGSLVERPREMDVARVSDFAIGVCRCGAVYACDVTGHNVGAAMVEALTFAAGGDEGLMWQLDSTQDYVEDRVENYDYREHTVCESRTTQHRAVLIFVRLGDDIRTAFDEKVRENLPSRPVGPAPEKTVTLLRSFSKKVVQKFVEENKEEELLAMAREDSRVLAALQRLLYSPDDVLRWRTVELMGKAAACIADTRPQEVADFLRRLLWFAADSAATSWGFLEATGAIISKRSAAFAGFVPPLLAFLKDPSSRVPALWAVGAVGRQDPGLIRGLPFFGLLELLDAPEPPVRAHAAWALGQMGAKEALGLLKKLEGDQARATIYSDGKLEDKTVGEWASDAMEKLARPAPNSEN